MNVEIPIKGLDCAECARHVQGALESLPGVQSVVVSLATEKALIRLDPLKVELSSLHRAIERAGYKVSVSQNGSLNDFTQKALGLFGLVFGAVLFVVVIGEWLGLFASLTELVPWPLGAVLVMLGGYPIFRNVLRATLQRRITAHTLMSVGACAALVVGEWATAMVVVFFMRVGDYAERFVAERARRAVKDLTALAPPLARVERQGVEQEIPATEVRVGEIIIVRPGEQIPVDGAVIAGQATVDQATITGESLPVELGAGAQVFAATIARLGSLRIRAEHVGPDTTFGRVIKLVEEAEAHRADVQRYADRFAGYYLPVVVTVALLTLLIRHDPLAMTAVLVVACSCSFALATPMAMLASIGAGAQRGLLIKGGKYLETLARADVLLIDKTGTLTLGRPHITDTLPFDGAVSDDELLRLAASAERDSEHPLAEAVRQAAHSRGLTLQQTEGFEALPGLGVQARLNGSLIAVGSPRMVPAHAHREIIKRLEEAGKTVLVVARDGRPLGLLAASDTIRDEVPLALQKLRAQGLLIEVLTGDNERAALALARSLGVACRAQLLPKDKIAIVKAYQQQGHTVVMIGDGVNDAPALAQADVGIAMGAAGTDIAIEAAHVALMRDDWRLIPQVFGIARRTMGVVKLNIAFTAVYNLLGLSLAALGFLPPILAAAAQSLPDLGILANSSRLLRQ